MLFYGTIGQIMISSHRKLVTLEPKSCDDFALFSVNKTHSHSKQTLLKKRNIMFRDEAMAVFVSDGTVNRKAKHSVFDD